MKATGGFTKIGPSTIVVAGYAAALSLLAQVLNGIPVGTAYAVWAGGGIVLVTLAAWLIYGQSPDAAGFLGIGFIVADVLVLNLVSKTSALNL